MNTEQQIRSASELIYDATIDALYADGELIGGASDMTREIMLDLYDGDDKEDMSDEDLFEALVTTENSDPNAEEND